MSTPSSPKSSAAQPSPAAPGNAAPETATRAAKPTRRPLGRARRVTYTIATCAIVLLVVVAVGRPRQATLPEVPAAPVPPNDAPQSVSEPVSTPEPPVAVAPRASAVVPTAAPTKKPARATAHAAAAPSTTSTMAVAETRGSEEAAPKRADVEPSTTAPASSGSAVETAAFAPVTITGCLEVSVNEDQFRLTDTEGGAAPKARSWRTGFLKKRSAPVDIAGPADGLSLNKQVGKRVAATGVLTNHTLKVDSVRVVSPVCN